MSRIAGLANSIRNSGVRLGPLDAVFAGADYLQGKQDGEDDLRAAAGAAGSTLGGWGGAMAGGSAGAAIGSVVPGLGTAIGGAIGAIAGGTLGGFAGGWGADRVDETIRGKNNNMAGFYSRNGYEDYNPNQQNTFEDLGNFASAGLLGYAGFQGGKSALNAAKDIGYDGYKTAVNSGIPRRQVLGAMASDIARNTSLGKGAKIAGAAGAALLANNLLGNPVGKLIDTATGQATNLDNDPANTYKSQMRQNANMSREQSRLQGQLTYDQLNNDGTLRYLDEQSEKDRRRVQQENNRQFYRDTLEARRNSAYSTRADAAKDLLAGYMQYIPASVANSVRNVTSARFV